MHYYLTVLNILKLSNTTETCNKQYCRAIKSHGLDLNEQILEILLLDRYCCD